jgi:phosphoribosylaminoimidazole-succinocarboxamide synthase
MKFKDILEVDSTEEFAQKRQELLDIGRRYRSATDFLINDPESYDDARKYGVFMTLGWYWAKTPKTEDDLINYGKHYNNAREYKLGKRSLCGVTLSEGLKENDRFPEPIITPASKAEEGHDEDISREDIIANGVVPEHIYVKMEKYTRALFQRGTEMAAARGLILVDTKYEFGLRNGEVILIDEIHTPDSSRYFYAEGYEERQANNEPQKQLSKEFVRQWLIENGFQGLEGQTMPFMPDEFVQTITDRYIELYERITGKEFVKSDTSDIQARIQKNVDAYLENTTK